MLGTADYAFLALVVGALTLFGGVLAWASWTESAKPIAAE